VVTKEVERVVTQEVVVTKEVEKVVTQEVVKPGATIVFWSTENQPERAKKTQAIIDKFTAKTGITVNLVLVDENNIDSLMAANQAAGTMPRQCGTRRASWMPRPRARSSKTWTPTLSPRVLWTWSVGLEPPTDFEKIRIAAETIAREKGVKGIMAGTDPGQVFTQQCFEHFALANGAHVVDADGTVTVNTPEMLEAFQFYADLMKDYGPGEHGGVVALHPG